MPEFAFKTHFQHQTTHPHFVAVSLGMALEWLPEEPNPAESRLAGPISASSNRFPWSIRPLQKGIFGFSERSGKFLPGIFPDDALIFAAQIEAALDVLVVLGACSSVKLRYSLQYRNFTEEIWDAPGRFGGR